MKHGPCWSFLKKNLAPKDPMLWLPEDILGKFAMIAFARFYSFQNLWIQIIPTGHQIRTMWFRDLNFIQNDHHGLFFHAVWCLKPLSAQKYGHNEVKVEILIYKNTSYYDALTTGSTQGGGKHFTHPSFISRT